MTTEKYPWPQWQLTAFVLNELKPEVAMRIQAAVDQDPSLAAEIVAIRATVAHVTRLYQQETIGIEPTKFDAVAAAITASPLANSTAVTKATDPNQRRWNWGAAVGLFAIAASLMLALVLAAPALQSFFAAPQDTLANAPAVTSQADALSTGEEVAVLADSHKELMNEKKYAEAEVVAEELTALAPESPASIPLMAKKEDSTRSENEELRQYNEEGLADGLKDIADVQLSRTEQRREIARRPSTLATQTDSAGDAGVTENAEVTQGRENEGVNALSGGMGSMGGMGGMGGSMMGGRGGDMMGGRENTGRGMGGMGMGMGMGGYAGDGGMGRPMSDGYDSADPYSVDDALDLRDALPGLAEESESLARNSNRAFRGRNQSRSWYSQPSHDRFAPIYENPFKSVGSEPLSTFSIDVDTASYVKTRQFLMQSRTLPPPNAVRVEEFINYFEYEYAGPQGDDPFAANLAVATCPWRPDHKLVRIALQAKKVDVSERPKANIVFLLDVSGSMDEPNKLPLVKESMRMLIQQLGENDRVAMVVYAGAAGCVLESTTGDKQDMILGALNRLNAGGSTNGGQGIQLAYDIARDHFIPGGINRVILCTDGDFNVGTTSTEGLVNLVVENAKSKVFLTVLGYGMGNTNDTMMEQISNKGNGVYGFVDSRREAQRQMVKQLAGNLMTIAKDVKIQVEFNPDRVASYRLIGYENRMLAKEDFANDKKDAGEIGAGHRVTALYEIEPIGNSDARPAPEEELRYQKKRNAVASEQPAEVEGETNHELLAVKLRYKQPEGDTSKLLTFPLVDATQVFADTDQDFKWAASVAQFAMLLRNSTHKGSANWSRLLEQADQAAGINPEATRQECLDMIRIAAGLSGM